ncbi:protein hugin [Glossina fuscipes fuscipes]
MSGLSFSIFVLVIFCSYAACTSESKRSEHHRQLAKSFGVPHVQQSTHQHKPQQNKVGYALKAEPRFKRSQYELLGIGDGGKLSEAAELNELIEELNDNGLLQSASLASQAPMGKVLNEIDVDNLPPVLYVMLLEKLKELRHERQLATTRRTPRLGRSIDFQLFDAAAVADSLARDFETTNDDNYRASHLYVPRVMKKSVPFKPRLGKRSQVCD